MTRKRFIKIMTAVFAEVNIRGNARKITATRANKVGWRDYRIKKGKTYLELFEEFKPTISMIAPVTYSNLKEISRPH